MHKYLPHTKTDIKEMLEVIGAKSIDELFSAIPKSLKLKGDYDIPSQLADDEIVAYFSKLAKQNQELTVFRGAGSYDHFQPSIVKSLTSRQEFLTSYTPYQPEVSQGTLQYIFEYQSMVCELTGMDVSNASMYDGSTATAEAMFMAFAQTHQTKILVSQTMHPRTIEVLFTYAKYRHLEIVLVPNKDGVTDLNFVKQNLMGSMGLILQNPNYYGIIESLDGVGEMVHAAGGLFIYNAEGQSLGILKTPKEYGADIAVGDLQSFGLPLNYGGAYVGYLATTTKLMRKMPGRICGITTDSNGQRAFVLTLQAREQHIRRAKANSNICSNQSLMALSVTIYLSALGKQGLHQLCNESLKASHYVYNQLLATKKFEVVYDQPFYKEFVLRAKFDLNQLNQKLLDHQILGPLHLGDNLGLFAVTEKRTLEELNTFIRLVGELS